MKFRKSAVATAVLTLCSIALSLGVAEIVTRVFHLAPGVHKIEIAQPYGSFVTSDNPVLQYVPKAGSPGISSYGIRDREIEIEKPAGVYRIVVIGDSLGFGFCSGSEALRVEDTFPKVLERSLASKTFRDVRQVEVINLCVSGYHTLQEAEFLETKGLALSPDLVVVAYCLNDAWTISTELRTLRRDARSRNAVIPPGTRLWASIFHNSALVRFVWQRSTLIRNMILSQELNQDIPREGFARIRAMADRGGFKVLVVVFPYMEDFERYTRTTQHVAVTTKAEESGFAVVDLLPSFRRRAGSDVSALRGRCAGEHPDENGHRLAATELEAFILGHYLTAEPSPHGAGSSATASVR